MTMADIKFRKKKLKDDIDMLESGFINRAEKVQSYIPITINPSDSIRKHPFRSVGIAIASGLALGLLSKKKRSRKDKYGTNYVTNDQSGFTSLLMYELKRLAANKAVSYVSDLIDQRVEKE
tara:strand:- start:115671 stop:116033 length:363 start_codon:yes stop_codon:yes gene_type:complete